MDAGLSDRHGKTALHRAVEMGRTSIAKLLLERPEVSMNTRSHKTGRTPFLVAVDKNYVGLVKWMLTRGADPNTTDDKAGFVLN